MAAQPNSIDAYLAGLSQDKRAALERLRRIIRAAAPKAEECISYRLPAFRQDGMLVAFGAAANHCAFYPMSSTTVEAHRAELEDLDTSKGSIRFRMDRPLPAALVRKLVKARVAENTDRRRGRQAHLESKKRSAKPAPDGPRMDPAIIELLREMDHPLKKEIQAVRRIILGVSPEIREGIKWNAPSFRTTEYFATLNHSRGGENVLLILHTGAKKKSITMKGKVADPQGLLEWLARDRCLVRFTSGKDVRARKAALEAIIREWIRRS